MVFLRVVHAMKIDVLHHAALCRRIPDELGMVFVDITELYLKKKLHYINFLHS